MHKLINKQPIASLITIAFTCGLLWRMELEYHGWRGLTWISYFHYAIPIGFGVFLLWANQLITISRKERIFINMLAILLGVLLYIGLKVSLTYRFSSGSSALLAFMVEPAWKTTLFKYAIFLIIPAFPICAYFILKAFKYQPSFKLLVMVLIGIIISIPISITLLSAINHKGEHDFIHSIKSGILIPFWVFSIGLLMIRKNDKEH